MWVIYKNSRIPCEISYSGITWDKAGIRDAYRETYDSYEDALFLANILTIHNPVGFSVEKIS